MRSCKCKEGSKASGSLLLSEACRFRLKPGEGHVATLGELFEAHSETVKGLERAVKLGLTSRKRLHEAAYKGVEREIPLLSHHVYTPRHRPSGVQL